MGLQPKVQPAAGLAESLNLTIDDLTGPTAYITGGVTISASAFQLQKIKAIGFMNSASGTYEVNAVSPKVGSVSTSVKVVWNLRSTGAEVGPGTNLSAETVRYHAFGV